MATINPYLNFPGTTEHSTFTNQYLAVNLPCCSVLATHLMEPNCLQR